MFYILVIRIVAFTIATFAVIADAIIINTVTIPIANLRCIILTSCL